MKRYDKALILKGFKMVTRMREHENGDYLRYEDVRQMLESVLDDCHLWETKPELLIKEWGE